jgi:hypothetical protein
MNHMLHEVKAEIMILIKNLIFARNLSLTLMIAIASLWGLAKLKSEAAQLTEQTPIVNISNTSATKVIISPH